MTKFDHKDWTHRALVVGGWTDLRPCAQRGGWWWGTTPDGVKSQPAPRLTYDHTEAMLLCAPLLAKVEFLENGVGVDVGTGEGRSYATVVFSHCENSPMIALARALTMALARQDEKQLSLFEGKRE